MFDENLYHNCEAPKPSTETIINISKPQVCHLQLSLNEFDKRTVELVPDKISIPTKIELPQYLVDESRVTLEYVNKGKI